MTQTPAAEWFVRVVFALVGLVHLLPATGVLGRRVLEKAYGVALPTADLLVLMQHRALMFGLLGLACGLAAWQPSWRLPVGVAALVSMVGFVLLAYSQPHGTAIARVVWADLALVPLLVGALWLVWRQA